MADIETTASNRGFGGLDDLVFYHLDRMSKNLTDMLDGKKFIPNSSKIVTYYTQVQHYENIIHPLLDAQFYELKETKINLPPLHLLDGGGPVAAIKYFCELGKWLKLLQIYANNRGLIKADLTIPIGESIDLLAHASKGD